MFNICVDPGMVYKLDDGILSRIRMIATKFNVELIEDQKSLTGASKGSPSIYPFLHIPYLAKKYQCDIETVMLWFLRLCADKFVSLIEDEDSRALELEMKNLTPRLRSQFNTDITVCITNCMHLCYMLRQRLPKKVFMPELTSTSLGETLKAMLYVAVDQRAKSVRDLIKEDWVNQSMCDGHPWKAIKMLKSSSIHLAFDNYTQNHNLLKQDVNKLIKLVFGSFSLKDGFSIGTGSIYVNSAWVESVINQERLKITADGIQKRLDDKIYETLISAEPDVSHIYKFDYLSDV